MEQDMDAPPMPQGPQRRPQRQDGEFDDEFQALRPSPPPERRRTEESALSPSTRAMLEKVKQSTRELEVKVLEECEHGRRPGSAAGAGENGGGGQEVRKLPRQ